MKNLLKKSKHNHCSALVNSFSKRFLSIISFTIFFGPISIFCQTGSINGQIFDATLEEGIPYANIYLPMLGIGAVTDFDGHFVLLDLPEGGYDLAISSIGYQDTLLQKVKVVKNKPTYKTIQLSESTTILEEVVVSVSPLSKKEKSVVSLRVLSANELKYNAGAGLDISQALKALPGVNSPQTGLSNELLVRGGSSSENAFYVDGIEMPSINHFAIQGTSGGLKSLLNLDFIKRSHLYTSGFPANRGNALSGVFDFQLKEGNQERIKTKALVGLTDAALWADGPINSKINFLASIRTSYVQFIMNALKLPYASNYSDMNYKLSWELDGRRKLSVVGIGSIDNSKPLQKNVHDDLSLFQFESLAIHKHSFLGTGLKFSQLNNSGTTNLQISYNHFKKENNKYLDPKTKDNLLQQFNSKKSDLRLTIDHNWRRNNFNWSMGGSINQINYQNGFIAPLELANFNSLLSFQKYNLNTQISQRLFNRFMLVNFGLSIDGNTVNTQMKNPFKQISPRLSISYALNHHTTINFNTGKYYQMPDLLALGYQNEAREMVNADLRYLSAFHLVFGAERVLKKLHAKINIEGFYKKYKHYPFLTEKNTSLATIQNSLSRTGFVELASKGQGRAYGGEFFYQQQLFKKMYGALTYTLLWSQSKESNTFLPTSGDNRHNISIRFGKHLKKDWHIGLKWQFQSGFPYTPADSLTASIIQVYDGHYAQNIRDFQQVNARRLQSTHTLDIRIDKTIHYKKWDMEIFLDVTNVFQNSVLLSPIIFAKRDQNRTPIINSIHPDYYETYLLKNEVSTFLPSFGIIAAFK